LEDEVRVVALEVVEDDRDALTPLLHGAGSDVARLMRGAAVPAGDVAVVSDQHVVLGHRLVAVQEPAGGVESLVDACEIHGLVAVEDLSHYLVVHAHQRCEEPHVRVGPVKDAVSVPQGLGGAGHGHRGATWEIQRDVADDLEPDVCRLLPGYVVGEDARAIVLHRHVHALEVGVDDHWSPRA
jgi:hypothetical protein